jgi:RNA polymerase sigma-70 factor (ECF subfamily)
MNVEQRLAWTLRHIEGERLEDVAARCGCSLATAKRRIAAAHAHLQAEMNRG